MALGDLGTGPWGGEGLKRAQRNHGRGFLGTAVQNAEPLNSQLVSE